MAKHRIELETNEVNQLLAVLGTRPINEALPLFSKISQQLQAVPPPPANGEAKQEPAPNG